MTDWKGRLAVAPDQGETAYLPIGHLKGEKIRIRTEAAVIPARNAEAVHARVWLAERPQANSRRPRPKCHFLPEYGVNGDMIGFFRYGDEYHLGYLTDPACGNWIENCCWAQAVSKDLFSWRERPLTDCKGNGLRRSSGCCFVDERNRSGLGADGEPPVLFFGYLVGEFDGRRFVPDAHGKRRSPYAGGVFSPRALLTADGRRIWMAALLNVLPDGGATLPVELSLKRASSGVPTLSLAPAREILSSDIRRHKDEEGNLCLYDAPLLEKFSRDGFRASVAHVADVDWK